MCRALLYLGSRTRLDDLLFKPDNSLVKQAYMPRMLSTLNLAGFGMLAWDWGSEEPEVPYRYASDGLPVFDRNLKSLSEKVRASCLLAHVRGVPSSTDSVVSAENNHPFRYSNCRIGLAHNGQLSGFPDMKAYLAPHIDPKVLGYMAGTTDSEWLYALILSQLEEPTGYLDTGEVKRAVEAVYRIVHDVRGRCAIEISSSANLFLSDGFRAMAVRYCFDFGNYPLDGSAEGIQDYHLQYLSMWYTLGREYGYHDDEWQTIGGNTAADTIIVASEPLTQNTSSWLEVPEYSVLQVEILDGRLRVALDYLDV